MARFAPSAELTYQNLDGEIVAIHFGRGTYYSLRGAAAPVFEAVAGGAEVAGVVKIFADPPADAEARVRGLVDAWVAEGLLVRVDVVSAGERTDGPISHLWTEPTFEVFTDMQQLLLADPIHDVGPGAWPTPGGEVRRDG